MWNDALPQYQVNAVQSSVSEQFNVSVDIVLRRTQNKRLWEALMPSVKRIIFISAAVLGPLQQSRCMRMSCLLPMHARSKFPDVKGRQALFEP